LNQSLENHKVELENLQQSLAAQVAWCNEQSQTYMVESAERARELEILYLIKKHLAEKAAAIKEYVSQREAGAPGF
jgi:NhaP-type Na+/H+ and K+/H+ antiporter